MRRVRSRSRRGIRNPLSRDFALSSGSRSLPGDSLVRTVPEKNSRIFAIALLAGAISLVSTAFANWPQWRGPHFNGSSTTAAGLATEWTTDKNVVWKAALPSWSAATPAVWENIIFVTSAQSGFGDPQQFGRGRGPGSRGRGGRGPGARRPGPGSVPSARSDDIVLVAIRRKDGAILWQRTLGSGNRIFRKQNLASPSPITDGEYVWALTGGGDFSCYSLDGKRVWSRNIQQDYGPFGLNHGYASSPRLHQGRLYLQVLHGMKTDAPSYVFAVDPKTGKTLWKVDRPTDAEAESPDDYSTPLIVVVGGIEQLVISGGDYVTGHDLGSGKELWRMGGFNPGNERFYRTIASSINIDGTVFTSSTRGNPFIAFRAGGEGWISDTAAVWKNGWGADVPTPTTDGMRIFVVTDRGVLNVLDPKTGELLAERTRLEPGTYSSSPLLADGKLYATNEEGTTTVVDVGRGYEILAINPLDSHTLASPIAVDNQIFIRTAGHLYCIAPD